MGALLYVARQAMSALPNIHLTGVFIVVLTVVYRRQALYPLYTFILMEGLFGGFNTWWLPYLYIWTVLWGAVMLLPKNMKPQTAAVVYALVCACHGFLYGVLYAPAQALIFGLSWEGMLAWIASGFTFDLIHGFSNLVCGVMIMPLVRVVQRMDRAIQ
ncbi:MAG: hypothetical protein IKJ51_02620 [Clostridia bacterium]|nr:hypothetical protein [Clostridia bacterium]